jgi:hypothetical protein
VNPQIVTLFPTERRQCLLEQGQSGHIFRGLSDSHYETEPMQSVRLRVHRDRPRRRRTAE